MDDNAGNKPNNYMLLAGLAVLIIVIVAAYFLLFSSKQQSGLKGSVNNPYSVSLGYKGAGYYNVSGQSTYIGNQSQFNAQTNQGTYATSQTTTAPATTVAAVNASALFVADLNKQQPTQNIRITYLFDSSLATSGGNMAFYKLGNDYKLVSPYTNPVTPASFQDYYEQLGNGTVYLCSPPANASTCKLLYSQGTHAYGNYGFFGFNFGSSPEDSQLMASINPVTRGIATISYVGPLTVAGRTCDRFLIQNATANSNICLDQQTGFALVNNVSEYVGTTLVTSNIVALTVANNVTAADFYQPQTTTTTTPSSSSTSTASTTSTSSSSTTTIPSGGGPGGYYLSQSQATSIMGTGGSYVESSLNQSSIKSAPPNDDLTAGYIVWYNDTAANSVLNEDVLVTGNATGVYKLYYPQYASFFNQTYLQNEGATSIQIVLNATTNGMTYSSSSYKATSGGITAYTILILGKKNNEFVRALIVLPSTSSQSASSIAATIAQDLP